MTRDFWVVKEKTHFDEINAINGKVDPAIWQATDAVRKIGNIGAHMEKDINLVIDVEPHEAQSLIQLIAASLPLFETVLDSFLADPASRANLPKLLRRSRAA